MRYYFLLLITCLFANFAEASIRMISLSPHLTELVYEAGAQDSLVATVEYANFPEAAKKIPRVGSFKSWDIERIIALRPDVILVWKSGGNQRQIKKLIELGFHLYMSEPREFDDISQTIREIGQLVGSSRYAQESANFFDREILKLEEKYQKAKIVDVFYQVWKQPLMTINGQQLISKVLKLCGGMNVFESLETLAPVVSFEALVMKDPDVIIGGARKEDQVSWLKTWKNWPWMKAVKKNHLYFINPDHLARQTPRILLGAQRVCQILDEVRADNEEK